VDQITLRVWNELRAHAGPSTDSPALSIAVLSEHLMMEETAISAAIQSLVNDGAVEFLKQTEIAALARGKRISGDMLTVDFSPAPRSSFLRVISPSALRFALKAKRALVHTRIEQLVKALSEEGGADRWAMGRFNGSFFKVPSEDDLRLALENAKNSELSIALNLAQIPDDVPPECKAREIIPKEVRDDVWRRDQGRCVQCGSRERLEFDHIIPVAKGGGNTARNLQLLCETCNRTKSDSI
jgi:HNH endonuclease